MKLIAKSLLGIGLTLGSVVGIGATTEATSVPTATDPTELERVLANSEALTACINYAAANGLGITTAWVPYLTDQAFCLFTRYEFSGSYASGGLTITTVSSSAVIPR